MSAVAVQSIAAIDNNNARDLAPASGGTSGPASAADYAILLKIGRLAIFGVCALLFHFANAALLPPVGDVPPDVEKGLADVAGL